MECQNGAARQSQSYSQAHTRAFTETKAYSPYGGDSENRKAMFAALKAEELEKALTASEKALASNYLDINAHFVTFAANKRLGLF